MFRVPKGLVVGIVAGAVLLGGEQAATAQTSTTIKTTTTTTTSTTTTTLLPHPFSPATRACIREARAQFKACRIQGGTTCPTDFQAAFAQCFGSPSCATKCETKQSTCLSAAPAARKSCNKACVTARRKDRHACGRLADGDNIWAGGDAACLTTAQANFLLCQFVCSQAKADCHTNFKFCIADCPNL